MCFIPFLEFKDQLLHFGIFRVSGANTQFRTIKKKSNSFQFPRLFFRNKAERFWTDREAFEINALNANCGGHASSLFLLFTLLNGAHLFRQLV